MVWIKSWCNQFELNCVIWTSKKIPFHCVNFSYLILELHSLIALLSSVHSFKICKQIKQILNKCLSIEQIQRGGFIENLQTLR